MLQLPEVLCIHLKRFRHELMFSSKIPAAVSFPLKGLDMRTYLHTDCTSHVTNYELFSVICHHGTAGGGHYTCFALNAGQWYEFDDQCVTKVSSETVQNCEAYVLFYRKATTAAQETKNKVREIAKNGTNEEVVYISKQWFTRFNSCAEPGPIDNSDFLCPHGSIHPDRKAAFTQLTLNMPRDVYEFLYRKFGGCPPVSPFHVCPSCQALQKRLELEMETFVQLNREFQTQEEPATHLLSLAWYTQWHNFIQKKVPDPPGPIDNSKINPHDLNEVAEVNEEIWNFFYSNYGGGPELRIKPSRMQNSCSETSLNEATNTSEEKEEEFIIPPLKKKSEAITINKSMYCHGEPMDTEPIDVNGLKEEITEAPSQIVQTKHENSNHETMETQNCNHINKSVSSTSNTSATDDETGDNNDNKARKHRRRRREVAK